MRGMRRLPTDSFYNLRYSHIATATDIGAVLNRDRASTADEDTVTRTRSLAPQEDPRGALALSVALSRASVSLSRSLSSVLSFLFSLPSPLSFSLVRALLSLSRPCSLSFSLSRTLLSHSFSVFLSLALSLGAPPRTPPILPPLRLSFSLPLSLGAFILLFLTHTCRCHVSAFLHTLACARLHTHTHAHTLNSWQPSHIHEQIRTRIRTQTHRRTLTYTEQTHQNTAKRKHAHQYTCTSKIY